MDMANWIPQNLDWIKLVSSSCLHKKGKDFQDYINAMVKDTFEIDEISLTLIARIYNIHTAALFQKNFVWSTQIVTNLAGCKIVLAYFGKMKFSYTIPVEHITLKLDVDLSVLDCIGNEYEIDLVPE